MQFGEGGAGTFSDGKLTTRISDSRCEYVLQEFVRHGAPKDILTTAKPHIGTDKLRSVLISMRNEIINLGGVVRFDAKLEDILLSSDNSVRGIVVNGEQIETNQVILAPGHSARDTFRMLASHDVLIESKEFSVGVRIEQLQSVIDCGLYGGLAGHPHLPKGEYQLSHRENGRCVLYFLHVSRRLCRTFLFRRKYGCNQWDERARPGRQKCKCRLGGICREGGLWAASV